VDLYAARVHRHSFIRRAAEILGLSAKFRLSAQQIELLNEESAHQQHMQRRKALRVERISIKTNFASRFDFTSISWQNVLWG
jgi:hypothetical protein